MNKQDKKMLEEAYNLIIKENKDLDEDDTGLNTFWEDEVNGRVVKVTIKDIIKRLSDSININPKKIKHLLINVKRDPVRVNNADLSYPIILAKSKGKFISILDGQHRVFKSLRDDVNVNAKILDLDLAPDDWKKIFI